MLSRARNRARFAVLAATSARSGVFVYLQYNLTKNFSGNYCILHHGHGIF